MFKHTQTIHRQFADEMLEFEHFVGLALKGLNKTFMARFTFSVCILRLPEINLKLSLSKSFSKIDVQLETKRYIKMKILNLWMLV